MATTRIARQTANESARYYSRYGCERDPFSDEGIFGLFYAGADRKKIVEEVLHAARFTRSPILLLGKQGCGKTVLLKELKQFAANDTDIAIVPVGLMQTAQQTLSQVLHAFRQPVVDGQSIFEQLQRWVMAQSSRQRHVFLCIDDAHNVSPELLEPVFGLIKQTDGYFSLLLAGDSQLDAELEPIARQNGFTLNKLVIPDMDEAQVVDYAMYRLLAAGFSGELPLTDIQIRAAQRRSNGNIAYLNELLQDMLAAGAGVSKPFKWSFPIFHLIVAVALITLLAYLVIEGNQQQNVGEMPESLPLSLEIAPVQTSSQENEPSGTEGSVGIEAAVNEVELATKASNVPDEDASVAEDGSAESSVDTQADTQAAIEDKPPTTAIAALKADEEASSSPLIAATVPSPRADKPAAQTEKAGDKISPNAETISSGEPVSAEVPSNQEPLGDAVSQRLQGWPDTGYALQVFGTHNAQRARSLVEEYFGLADLLFYETMHNGKPWYVVISGPYTGRQAAQKSAGQLPDAIQRLRPWPRNIASIKRDIERFQQIKRSQSVAQ